MLREKYNEFHDFVAGKITNYPSIGDCEHIGEFHTYRMGKKK